MDNGKTYLYNYIQEGNRFSAYLKLEKLNKDGNNVYLEVISPAFVVCSIAILKVKVGRASYYNSGYTYDGANITHVSFEFTKRIKDCLNCVLNLTMGNSTLTIASTESSGGFVLAPVSPSIPDLLSGNVKVAGVIDIFTVPSPSSALYDDKDLIDFSLKGIDGSVDVHRHIMAASSPVLKAMLTGPWREAKQGILDLKDVHILTIQHLKDYIYLNIVPETGLDELIKLAHFLSMTELVKICVFNILNSLTLENFMYWNHFAAVNNITDLTPWLLDFVIRSDDTLGITDIISSYAEWNSGNKGNEEKKSQDTVSVTDSE